MIADCSITSNINSIRLDQSTKTFPLNAFPLNEDILWRTLVLIADMGQEDEEGFPAIITLRYTSQVSSSWRAIILSSASFWGRTINLNHLNQKSHHWRKEVLRRTGKSLLHIQGVVERWTHNRNLLELILSYHWDRVKVLDLKGNSDFAYLRDQLFIEVFQRPAPSLEIFRIPKVETGNRLSTEGFIYFSNKAPMLRHFEPFLFELRSQIQAPWIPQLRTLRLISSVNPYHILEMFARMPVLEEFIGSHLHEEDAGSRGSLPKVTRMSLNQITFRTSSLIALTDLLSNITPGNICSLDVALLLPYSLTPAGISALCTVISSYTPRYFNTQQTQTATIKLSQKSFDLYSWNSPNESYNLKEFRFYLHASQSLPTSAASKILQALATCIWTDIKTLRLMVEGYNIMGSNPHFTEFILRFTSVDTLRIDGATMLSHLLIHAEDRPELFFPSLRKIVFNPYPKGKNESAILKRLVEWRRSTGRPIEMLGVALN